MVELFLRLNESEAKLVFKNKYLRSLENHWVVIDDQNEILYDGDNFLDAMSILKK